MNGYYNPPEEDAPRGTDWLEVFYTIFLVIIFVGFIYWLWYSHVNSPCYKDPVPEQYKTQCLYGYK